MARAITRRPSLVFALSCVTCVVACGPCDVDPTEQLSPAIAFADERDFGSIYIDVVTTLTFEFENVGSARGEISIGSVPAPFAVESASAFELAPETRAVTLSCTPDALGPLSLAVVVDNDGEPTPVRLLATVVAIPSCDDDNSCTVDVFNRVTLLCDNTVREGACDDDSVCTLDDTCVSGRCVGDALDCDDDIACTLDRCDAVSGCEQVPVDERCADDDPCSDDVCLATGCVSSTSPDGTPCAPGVTCVVAPACFSGTCVDVVVPDGTTCASPTDELCDSHICANNVCVESADGIVHTATFTREFLSTSSFALSSGNRFVILGNEIITLANGRLRRFSIRDYGFEFVSGFKAHHWLQIFKVTESIFIAERDTDFFDVISIDESGFEIIQTRAKASTIRGVFATPNGEVGICDRAGVYHYSSDILVSTFNVVDTGLCHYSEEAARGDRVLVLEDRPNERWLVEYQLDGSEVLRVPFELSASQIELFPFGDGAAGIIFREAGRKVFWIFNADLTYTDVDVFGLDDLNFFGAVGHRVFVADEDNVLSFGVDEQGQSSLPTVLRRHSSTRLLPRMTGSTPDHFLFWTGDRLHVYERLDGDEVGALFPDGFSLLSLVNFAVGPNGTLTVFGSRYMRRGDITSLTSPINPMTTYIRGATVGYEIIFDNGVLVATKATAYNNNNPCAIRCMFSHNVTQMKLTAILTDDLSERRLVTLPNNNSARDADFGDFALYDRLTEKLSVFEVPTYVGGVNFASPIFEVSLAAADYFGVFTKILPGQKLVAVSDQDASLFDYSQNPGIFVAEMRLQSGGLSGRRIALSVHADDEQWIVVQSGGTRNLDPTVLGLAPVILRQRLSNGVAIGPLEVKVIGTDPVLSDSRQYVVKVMAMADNLLYLESSRESGLNFIDVYSLDDLSLVERIPFTDKPLSMAVLDDGRRLVGTRHALHFMNLECVAP